MFYNAEFLITWNIQEANSFLAFLGKLMIIFIHKRETTENKNSMLFHVSHTIPN